MIPTTPLGGGEEEAGRKNNFPADMQTSETALLFLQLIMRRLKQPERNNGRAGRGAVVVPNGTLFGDGFARGSRRSCSPSTTCTRSYGCPTACSCHTHQFQQIYSS